MVPGRPCRRESPANRHGIELNYANGVARELTLGMLTYLSILSPESTPLKATYLPIP